MSVSRCQQEVSSQEFTRWVAYWRFHCIDSEGWHQAAMIAATVARSQGAKVAINDFLPTEKLPQTNEDMLAQMTIASGSRIK